MNKPSSLIWMVLIFILILPTPAGRFFIDLAGGIFLIFTLIPLILLGAGWLAWKKIQSQVQTCEFCGSSFLNTQTICPVCGKKIQMSKDNLENTPASAATIDIKSQEIE